MNILLIHQYFQEKNDPGGLRWNAMAKLWVEEGHCITVIAGMTHYTKGVRNPKYNNKYTHIDNFAPGIKVIRTHVSDTYNNNFRGRMNAYFAFVWSGIYGGLFKAREKYDCIVVSSPPLTVGIIGLTLSFWKRIPFIFEIRDLWPESAIDTGVLKNKFIINLAYMLEKRIYKKADLINVLTPAMRDKLIAKKGIDSKKIIYFPNAADFDLTDEVVNSFDKLKFRIENNIPTSNLVLCYVGAHGLANHLIQLLDAASLLTDKPVTFMLIGDGMQKHMLKETCIKRELKNVIFVDSVPKEQALNYILASDIGLSILKQADTFKTVYSNKTFDYMACKKPVLMAIDGISRKLIEDAQNGFFVEPENAAAFVERVNYFLKHPEEMSILGNNGYNYAKLHFDRNKLGKAYINSIESSILAKNIN